VDICVFVNTVVVVLVGMLQKSVIQHSTFMLKDARLLAVLRFFECSESRFPTIIKWGIVVPNPSDDPSHI